MLPAYTIVHRQDWFLKENYKADTQKDEMSFLDRSFELHFNERPFLNHFSYLFITKTTKERSRKESNFSILCRGNIIPKEVRDKDVVSRFLESVDQFERILNDSAFIRLERLTTDEIVGTPQQAGLIEKYFSLSQQDTTTLKDIQMSASKMRIGDNTLCVHTLSDVDDLPGSVQTDTRYEKYSTDRSDCRLSFAAPVGLMLSCDHIYNQFLFIDDSTEILQRFEKTARNMHSLSKYSRANQLNKQWIDAYLDEAHSFGLTAIRCHCNVMAWSDSREKLKVIKNDTGSALALMGCKPRYNTIDAPTLYWAGIPGGEGDFPAEESFYTFIEQGVCFFTGETNYADSLSPFGIKMADRTNGKPLHLDISDEQLDLLNKRFVVFEIDEIKEHKILFPVVTVIIMEAFINKMRRLHGVRKMIVVEEAWKAIAREGMADYIRFLYKTVRKYFGEAVVVTQELDDIVSSPIIKDTIVNNADCKILLDQRKYINKFDSVQSLLGLTDKEKGQILSINQANDPARKYKEV